MSRTIYLWPEEKWLQLQLQGFYYSVALGGFMIVAGLVFFNLQGEFTNSLPYAAAQTVAFHNVLSLFPVFGGIIMAVGIISLVSTITVHRAYKTLLFEIHPELQRITIALENFP